MSFLLIIRWIVLSASVFATWSSRLPRVIRALFSSVRARVMASAMGAFVLILVSFGVYLRLK